MKITILLLLVSFSVLGQTVAQEDKMFNNERKRFTNTCIAMANKLSSENITNFDDLFTTTLTEEQQEQLATFNEELLAYKNEGLEYVVSADMSENKIYVLLFQLGETNEITKKIFLLFEPDDALADDFMIISTGTEKNTEVPYGNAAVLPPPPPTYSGTN